MTRANRSDGAGDDIRQRLRGALRAAMRSRDVRAASALRSALAAIDNAEAIPVSETRTTATTSPHFAGAAAGLGAAEAQRRSLTGRQICEVVEAEIAERVAAAANYEGGHPEQASRLRREAQVLSDAACEKAGMTVCTRSGRSRAPGGDRRILQHRHLAAFRGDLGEPDERQLALLVIGQPEM